MVLETTADGEISVRASAGEKSPAPPPVPSPDVRRTVGHMRDRRRDAAQRRPLHRDHVRRARARGRGHAQPGRRADRVGRDGVRGARGVQPPARRLLPERPRLRGVGRQPADGRGRARARGRREPQGAGARDPARGAAQRRAAAGAHGQLGHRLRHGHAHAVGEPARDARAGLLRLHRRHVSRAACTRTIASGCGRHGHRARGRASAEFRVAAAGRPRAGALRPSSGAIRDEAGVATGLRGTVKDVTEERRSEADLRRSEERFRQGFDNAPIAMSLVDPASMRYVRVNDAFCTMVGRTRAALLELTADDLEPPRSDRPASGELTERALSAARRHRGVGVRQRHARAASRTAPSTCCSGRWSTSPSARRARRR